MNVAGLVESGSTEQEGHTDPNYYPIFDRVYLVICNDGSENICQRPGFEYFCVDHVLVYAALETDFGPFNLRAAYDFCQMMDTQLECTKGSVAMITSSEPETITNAVFLLGVFMVMVSDEDLQETLRRLESFNSMTIPFRDVSRGPQKFELNIADCLAGLYKAKEMGWIDFGPDGFDFAEYSQLDSPINADLHEIVPGKFIAMRGPRDLPGNAVWRDVPAEDGGFGHREFSPAHYSAILTQFDVQAVIRCNAPQYDRAGFEVAGIAVVELAWEDCEPPPVDIVAKFLAVAERIPGALALHCSSGLGRSCTLIGMYMMKHFGFTAREAIGWMRIVRPGRRARPTRVALPPFHSFWKVQRSRWS